MKFLGCDINLSMAGEYRASVELSMHPFISRVRSIQVNMERKFSPQLLVDERERSEYRSLAGVLLYLGQAVLTQACMVASKMQQKLGLLKVGHLLEANAMVSELRKLNPALIFRAPDNIRDITISTFSDASHGAGEDVYGQKGGI